MRIVTFLLLIPIAFAGGCAGMIAQCGTDPTALKTQKEVHDTFGEPVETGSQVGVTKEGEFVPKDAAFYEDYTTRRKIATPYPGDGYIIFLIGSLGTLDLLLVPQQFCLMTKRAITGQTVRIIYDSNGKVIAVNLDGESLYFPSR